MERRRFELAAVEVYEVGKAWEEADGDIREAMDFCLFYAQQMRLLGRPKLTQHVLGEESYQHYWPRGVALVIAPWNFPIAILTGMVSAAIVTGNTVIMKPAEPSSVCGALLMEMFEEAGVPPGVLNFLPGHGSVVGQHLVDHPEVVMIAFTGSREVGLRIWKSAGNTLPGQRELKRVVCEMGGKNAIIVDSDADLDETIVDFDLLRLRLPGPEMFRALPAHRARRKLRSRDRATAGGGGESARRESRRAGHHRRSGGRRDEPTSGSSR